jgi:hypothetical protein
VNWASVVAPSDAANYASVAASTGAVNYASVAALSDAGKQAAVAAQPVCCSADFAAGQDTDKLFYPELLPQQIDSRSEKLLK